MDERLVPINGLLALSARRGHWPGQLREVLRDRVLVKDDRHDRFGRLVRHSLALAVCGQFLEVLLELLRSQLALAVAGKYRLHAQVRAQDHAAIRSMILDDVVA